MLRHEIDEYKREFLSENKSMESVDTCLARKTHDGNMVCSSKMYDIYQNKAGCLIAILSNILSDAPRLSLVYN